MVRTPRLEAPPTASLNVTRKSAGSIAILRELWNARDLVEQFVRRDLTLRYTQAVMGFAWAVLTPLMIVGSGLLVRYLIARASGDGINTGTMATLSIKSIAWSFFSGAVATSTVSVLSQSGLIGKIYFPRETLPLSSVLTQAFDSFIAAVAVSLVLPFLGVPLSASLLWAPVLAMLLLSMTLGLALWLSCANLFYRDVKYIVQVLLTFGIFATPVFFEPAALGPRWGWYMLLHPLTPILEGLRLSVVEGNSLLHEIVRTYPDGSRLVEWSPWMLVYAFTWALVLVASGMRMFRGAASRFAEVY